MDRLPLEILDMIFQLCTNGDLKTLRLTSRTFSNPVLRHLFRSIRTFALPRYFEYLPKIARHPEIRKYVRNFEYDTRMIEISVEPDLCDESEDRRISEQLEQMSHDEIRELELACIFLRAEQQRIGTQIDDAEELKKSIARFPALEHVTLWSGLGPFGPPTNMLSNLTDEHKQMLSLDIAPPNASGGWESHNAKTIALFRSLSAVRNPLRSLTLNAANWDFLNGCTKSQIKQIHRQIESVRVLNLAIKIPLSKDMVSWRIGSNRCIQRVAYRIGDFMASATNLETLTFTLLHVDRQQRTSLSDISSLHANIHTLILDDITVKNYSRQPWPRLRGLALNNIAFEDPTSLKRLIETCSSTLRRLRISNAHFLQGSWLRMLRLIPGLISPHRLEQFVISHEITSEYEHWDAKPRNHGSACANDCLRDQIEQWVEDGGEECGRPFPLLPDYVPSCLVHFRPSPIRLLELRDVTLDRLRDGDRSFVWRYDRLIHLWVRGDELDCSQECLFRLDDKIDVIKDSVEEEIFDIAEVYDEYLADDDADPFQYVEDNIEYDLPISQALGWPGMFMFDPLDDRTISI